MVEVCPCARGLRVYSVPALILAALSLVTPGIAQTLTVQNPGTGSDLAGQGLAASFGRRPAVGRPGVG